MIWILISILMAAAFGNIMRHAQQHGRNMAWVGAWNYAAAAVVSWLFWIAQGFQPLTWYAICYGIITGVSFIAAYFLLVPCLRTAGVGITQAVAQLSVILPIVASIFIWGEKPGLICSIGLALILVAFPLLACGKAVPQSVTGGKFWVLLVLFITEGIASLLMKAYSQAVPGREAAYLCFVFTTAAAGNIILAARMTRPYRADIKYGVSLGLVNVVACVTFLFALGQLPGFIVFPSISIGGILLASLLAMFLWGERYRGLALWGMALAVLALILINFPH